MPFTEVAPGVFVHQRRFELQSPDNNGDMANVSFIIGSDAVAVIDTLGSAKVGQELRSAIKAVTDKPIRYVINSQLHPNHVFGLRQRTYRSRHANYRAPQQIKSLAHWFAPSRE
ncbi:MAG: MBL fold metallo-hydrolase [Proteobacteria bacterium]|nr:MBL fold metallo-hydrolase [Pseudomonadota bacterium]